MAILCMILTIVLFVCIGYAIGREHGKHDEKNRCVRLCYQTVHNLKRNSPTVMLIINAILDDKEEVVGVSDNQ